jgi:hypothetical protein
MTKKTKSTYDQFIASLSNTELKKFNDEYRELLLSEIIIAAMEKDNLSVRKLAQIAGVSPTIVQAMRTQKTKDFSMQTFFKVLKGIGCKSIMVEFNGHYIPLEFPITNKK